VRIKTGFSFRHAIGKIDAVISRLQEIGWMAAPISDRLSTFGYQKWTKAATKAGLRPIYGVELPCTPAIGEKSPALDWWTFFAIDSLRPLHDLVFRCTAQVTGKNTPVLTYAQALASPLIKIAGHRVQIDHIDPAASDFFVALSGALPTGLYKKLKTRQFKFIASSDNVYPREGDRELYRVTLGSHRADTQTYPQHIQSDAEWRQSIYWFANTMDIEAALANRTTVMDRSVAQLKKGTLLKPKSEKTLRQLCEEGALRTGTNLEDPIYKARLERELKLIAEKNYEDYFLILADMINYAKQFMVVGPARGSSCGSLVCYLINITAIDPIPFNLLFERFIDVNRSDPPDIDVDFSDERRWMVFEYAEKKYGADHVARLGTVNVFRARSAMNQAGIALRIPKWEIEKVMETVIERSSGDARAMQTLEDSLQDTETGRSFIARYPEACIITPIEGHPSVSSQHAAGIIITQEPVKEFVAVDARTRSAMCDKYDASALDLLKIDALGLTQLGIFERTMDLIGVPSKSGWLEKLPLDDPAAFEVLNKGHYAGVFQFNGDMLQTVTEQIAASDAPINHINDIVQITAAARPGPSATGGTQRWIERRSGRQEVPEVHPMLTELTAETFGVTLYQETVMLIGRQLGQMTWEDVALMRRAMSSSLGDEYFQRFRQSFLDGAVRNGIEESLAIKIWNEIASMGSWAMNKSHCVAYGLVSYFCCYLKAHYPMEFAAASLDAEKEPARQIALLKELASEGITYKSFDPVLSEDRWTIDREHNRLVGPLTVIKGIGPKIVDEIKACRRSGQPLRPVVQTMLASAKTEIDSLHPVADALSKIDLGQLNIVTPPIECRQLQPGLGSDIVMLGVAFKIQPFDMNEHQRLLKRNGRVYRGDQTKAVNLILADDTDQVLCRIDPQRYEKLGLELINRGGAGKSLYAVKGYVPPNFRMIIVDRIKYLGSL